MGSQFAINALKTAGTVAFAAGVVHGLSKVAVVASRLLSSGFSLVRLNPYVKDSNAEAASNWVLTNVPGAKWTTDFFKNRDIFAVKTGYNEVYAVDIKDDKDLLKTIHAKGDYIDSTLALAVWGVALTALSLIALESRFSAFHPLTNVFGHNWSHHLPRFGL